jgi:hypothetical protein
MPRKRLAILSVAGIGDAGVNGARICDHGDQPGDKCQSPHCHILPQQSRTLAVPCAALDAFPWRVRFRYDAVPSESHGTLSYAARSLLASGLGRNTTHAVFCVA